MSKKKQISPKKSKQSSSRLTEYIFFLTEREIKIYRKKVDYLHLSSKTERILHILRLALQDFIHYNTVLLRLKIHCFTKKEN